MPINLPGVPFKLSPQDMGGFDLGAALNNGLKLNKNFQEVGALPQKIAQELLAAKLKNKHDETINKYLDRSEQARIGATESNTGLNPFRQQLMQAQIKRQEQLANQPYGGNLSGIAREAYGIAQITGQDPKEVGQKLYQNKLDQTKALNSYRESLINLAPKKASTQLAKLEQEEQEAQAGFLPGSNGKQKLNTEQQESLVGQYQLARQKLSSDVDTRKKLLFANNIDKTLSNIDVNDLTQYSGISGEIEKKIAEGKSLTGAEEKNYDAYQKSLTASKLLAKQVRQFYGDSITPGIQNQLGELTNPSSWKLNPRVAKEKFNQFKSILQSETQTYRDALKGNNVYTNSAENPNNKANTDAFINQMSQQLIQINPNATPSNIKHTAEIRKITPEQVIKELLAKAKRKSGGQ